MKKTIILTTFLVILSIIMIHKTAFAQTSGCYNAKASDADVWHQVCPDKPSLGIMVIPSGPYEYQKVVAIGNVSVYRFYDKDYHQICYVTISTNQSSTTCTKSDGYIAPPQVSSVPSAPASIPFVNKNGGSNP